LLFLFSFFENKNNAAGGQGDAPSGDVRNVNLNRLKKN